MVSQFKSIFDLIQAFPDEQTCIDHLEKLRWGGNPVSPFDPASKIYKCKLNRYKCVNTKKYFNVRTGTIFDNTKIPLQKWFLALYVFSSHKKGISSHQLARDITITQKSAWFMLHRLRYAFEHPNFKAVMGNNPVEVDETFVGGHDKNKHTNKKTEGNQGRSLKKKSAVLGIKERGGYIVAQVIVDTKGKTIRPIIDSQVNEGATVYTDEWLAYDRLHLKYDHKRVNHGAKEYVNFMAHTNGVENFWSHMKRGLDGIYHWVSKDHLQSYVTEYSLRQYPRGFNSSQI